MMRPRSPMLERHRIGEAEWIDVVDPNDDELAASIDEFHLDELLGNAVDAHRA
jgi:hypothetical protein